MSASQIDKGSKKKRWNIQQRNFASMNIFHERLTPAQVAAMPPFVADYRPYSANQLRDVHFISDCAKQWDVFYINNGRNAYRDRHYILREFHPLNDALLMCRELNGKKTATEEVCVECSDNPSSSGAAATTTATAAEVSEQSSRRRRDRLDESDGHYAVVLLDFGCGVGNLSLPILDDFGGGELRVVASDLSSIAVQRLQETLKERNMLKRVATAFVCDISSSISCSSSKTNGAVSSTAAQQCKDALEKDILVPFSFLPTGAAVFASLVFVLCSVKRCDWGTVAQNIADSMSAILAVQRERSDETKKVLSSSSSSPSAFLFFRDYCNDDLAMHRFHANRIVVSETETTSSSNGSGKATTQADEADDRKATKNEATNPPAQTTQTFMRTNGTLSHFFSEEEVRRVFSPYFEFVAIQQVTMPAPNYDVMSVDGEVSERKFLQAIMRLRQA